MREFKPTLRIGDGPWYIASAHSYKTYREARAIGAMLAKAWLGVAASDVESPDDRADKRRVVTTFGLSLRALTLKHRKNLNEEEFNAAIIQQVA